MNKVVKLTFISCIFLSLTSISFGFIDFYFYYVLVIFTFPLLLWKYRSIDKWILISFIYLLIVGVLNVFLNNNTLFQFLKIYLGAIVFYLLYFFIIKSREFDLLSLFRDYYKFSVIHAYVGVLQFVSFLVNFKYGYDFSWFGMRTMIPDDFGTFTTYPIHGFTSEPAGFVIVQSGAILFAVDRFSNSTRIKFGTKLDAFLIISTLILTLSSTGYFALFIALLLHFRNDLNIKKLVIGIVVLSFSLITLYTTVSKFSNRLNTLLYLTVGNSLSTVPGENSAGSSVILFNHFTISLKNAQTHYFGTGLGSHHVAFERYNTLETWFTGYGPFSMILNLHDASSLFSRILSESGFVGIVLLLVFLFKFYSKENSSVLTLLNHTSLVVILTHLLRGGHYFICGLPFFILSYYYSSKFSKSDTT